MNVFERWRASAPWLLSLSRIIVGFLFTQIGTGKLWAFPAAIMPGGALAQFGTQTWWAAVLEAFGGGLILLGLFRRRLIPLICTMHCRPRSSRSARTPTSCSSNRPIMRSLPTRSAW